MPGVGGPARRQTTFRAAIFNIHSGVGNDNVRDLSRTADALRDIDFCALNEVRGHMFGQPSDQAHELGLRTGRAWLFMPTEHRFWHDHFGNGILSRLPVTECGGPRCPPTAPPTATATSPWRG